MPIAKDIDESLLCVKINSALKDGETVIIWDTDNNEQMEDLKVSLGEYLEQIRDKLLSKKLIYEEELGLVSIS